MEHLDGWVFTYNPVEDNWLGTKREHYHDMFNNYNSPNVIKTGTLDFMLELIVKNRGDIPKIKSKFD